MSFDALPFAQDPELVEGRPLRSKIYGLGFLLTTDYWLLNTYWLQSALISFRHSQFPGRVILIQGLQDHHDESFFHHLPGGRGAVNVDFVVDPDFRNNSNIEIPAQFRKIVGTDGLDRDKFVLCGEDICEPNRLGTVSSIR